MQRRLTERQPYTSFSAPEQSLHFMAASSDGNVMDGILAYPAFF